LAASASPPRLDALKRARANSGADSIDRARPRSAHPVLECLQRGHLTGQDLNGPRSIDVRFGAPEVCRNIVQVWSRQNQELTAASLTQLHDVVNARQIALIGVEAMNDLELAVWRSFNP
jgi:hypothetical protein